MGLSWWLEIGLALFVTAWLIAISGWVVHVVEWRRFRSGHAAAAGRGLVLSSRIAKARVSRAESLAGVGGGRAASSNTLLFPLDLPYANSLHWCRVPWYGRAVVDGHQVRVEARVPFGLVMFVGGWFAMAISMTVMLVAAGALVIAVTAGSVATAGAMGYRHTFRRERETAERFVVAFARNLENAA